MKCVRVATAHIHATDDRLEAEKQADIAVIGTHAAQRAAKYAKVCFFSCWISMLSIVSHTHTQYTTHRRARTRTPVHIFTYIMNRFIASE